MLARAADFASCIRETQRPLCKQSEYLEHHHSLDSIGIHNVYFESLGTAHEGLTLGRDLREFAALIFGTSYANKQ